MVLAPRVAWDDMVNLEVARMSRLSPVQMVLSAKLVIKILPERSRSITNRTWPTALATAIPRPWTVETAYSHTHAKTERHSLNVATTSGTPFPLAKARSV